MRIANLAEFTALAESTIPANTRSMNPARLWEGAAIVGGPTVKTVGEGCTPETVHINNVHCYDTRVDVQVRR